MMTPSLDLTRDHYPNDVRNAWLTMLMLGFAAILAVALIVAVVL
jgi:hypothetical protein